MAAPRARRERQGLFCLRRMMKKVVAACSEQVGSE